MKCTSFSEWIREWTKDQVKVRREHIRNFPSHVILTHSYSKPITDYGQQMYHRKHLLDSCLATSQLLVVHPALMDTHHDGGLAASELETYCHEFHKYTRVTKRNYIGLC